MDIKSLQYEALAAASRDLRMNFRQYWSSAFTPGRDGTAALIAPASYRLDISGTRLLIDPVFRFEWEKEAVADRWISDLLSADGIIYTHSHADHYDPGTAYEAMKCGAKIWLPEFLPQSDDGGFKKIRKGESFEIGSLRITPYDSAHFSPDGSTGVPSFGYIMESSAGVLLFPCDVRNYDTSLLPDIHADIVFAHVWLGRGNALNVPCEPYLSDFARFAVRTGPSKIFLAHLYETGRVPEEMWTYLHAGLCMDRINEIRPSANISVMRPGRVYKL